ncbi:MAG: hypothetical protein IH988_02665 [Planctomycetes bacterium]|nr:hypothetical protein [Planctomycetota bacterium]
MMRKSTLSLSCSLMVVAMGTTNLPGAVGESGAVPAAAQRLVDDYPGLRVHMDGADVRAVYGQAMTSADTAERAAAWWLEDHSAALGVQNVDLQLMRSNTVNPSSTFTVFVYQQYLSGLPVEFGHVRVLVRNGVPSSVVYVGARLAQAPADGFPAVTIGGATALASVQAMGDYAHLSEWTNPELVVYFGDDLAVTAPSVRAWEFQGTYPVLSDFERYSFFVNAADGTLAHVRNDVHHTDVEGHVSGMATPGTFPDSNTNPPVEMDMEDVQSRIIGGDSVFSDENGDFVIPNDGDTEVTIRVDPFGR